MGQAQLFTCFSSFRTTLIILSFFCLPRAPKMYALCYFHTVVSTQGLNPPDLPFHSTMLPSKGMYGISNFHYFILTEKALNNNSSLNLVKVLYPYMVAWKPSKMWLKTFLFFLRNLQLLQGVKGIAYLVSVGAIWVAWQTFEWMSPQGFQLPNFVCQLCGKKQN